MAMTPAGRGGAIYNAIAQSPNFGQASAIEQAALKTQLIAIFGNADLSYIVGAAQVNPGTLSDPGGATVATAGGPSAQTGTVTSPVSIVGLGTIS